MGDSMSDATWLDLVQRALDVELDADVFMHGEPLLWEGDQA